MTKIPCKQCGSMILPSTATKWAGKGLCGPCDNKWQDGQLYVFNNPNKDEFKEEVLPRLKKNWTYQIWRATTPDNHWLQSLTKRSYKYYPDDKLFIPAKMNQIISYGWVAMIHQPEWSIYCLKGSDMDLTGVRCWKCPNGRFQETDSQLLSCSGCNKVVQRYPGKPTN